VAFFAMTGRSFWRACAGPQPDLAAWQQELMAPRTPPSLRALELGVSVPGTIDKVMMRALSPDPNERPRSVGEFAQALAQAIVSRDTAATRGPARVRFFAAARRRNARRRGASLQRRIKAGARLRRPCKVRPAR
jgi:hypothetical protein